MDELYDNISDDIKLYVIEDDDEIESNEDLVEYNQQFLEKTLDLKELLGDHSE